MAGTDLFKKLTFGAKFDFKRFKSDADRLKIAEDKSLVTNKENSKLDPPVIVASRNLKRKIDDNSKNKSKKRKLSESDEDPESQISNRVDSETYRKKRKKKPQTAQKLAQIKQEQVNHFRNKNHIHVYGSDIADPIEKFKQLAQEYGVEARLLANLETMGFKIPTVVEMQAIPAMINRREVMVCAPTGSGKTLAFVLPILHHLKKPSQAGVRALVLAPTRELAMQIHRDFCQIGEGLDFKIKLIQKTTADKIPWLKADVVVTTPKKLAYALKKFPAVISLTSVEWLVLDESDKLFETGDTGFREQLATIYNACNSKDVRRAMFSATFSHDVEEWCQLNLNNVIKIYIGAINEATKTIDQKLLYVGDETGKLVAIRDLIQKGIEPPVLVFVQSKERANELFRELLYDGLSVDVIHSDRTDIQRDKIVQCFHNGSIWILICTELMGRGIDFKGVNLVINYDFPNSAVSYIHRIGRTGRAGRPGKAITFLADQDRIYLRGIVNLMRQAGCEVPDYMLAINAPSKRVKKKLAEFVPLRKSISTNPDEPSKKKKKKDKSKGKKKGNSKKRNKSKNVDNKTEDKDS